MKAHHSLELLIVMPVYNEQASIRKVVNEWFFEVENWTEHFKLLVIDDGSRDNTLQLLKRLRHQLGERFEYFSRENRGHGQSCLQGYRIAAERNTKYVMQIDSDGQCDPQYFFKLWRIREQFDVIYGVRARRDDGLKRVVASRVLQIVVFAVTGAWCADGNVPYRLMDTQAIKPFLDRIPPDFFLANVGLAAVLRKQPNIRHGSIPIHFRERYGGEPSVPLSKFGGRASQLIRQLRGVLE